ncbi:YeeE/YedE family protein [Sinomicrobium weinanense]|uniref:YeeE/YedE family protein n=1 Tax=Sinomicrobium weinanense TaxID=2842200 RepID=A0A926JPN0_9FLAO|nr:YeeE/YedE thiosulfate transporter family protein [Sinomicrobium weinanense]MBC9795148.1 YeeE/YedE family protein [Sinomicrobium weinanense]MBU3121925.1 YeeE/YedE family protein [Sinomicrobium weinanense]
MDLIYKPFPWYLSGFLIGLVMLLLIYMGKNFGMSSNLRTLCSVFGAGKYSDFFKFNWKAQRWNLMVVLGAMIGGFITVHFLSDGSGVNINPETIAQLSELHIDAPEGKLLPDAVFGMENAFTVKGLLILLAGGFLVGFGSRYAGGCTSGHAISGISNLQLPSLIAVIGFFLGGLLMAHFILPFIF